MVVNKKVTGTAASIPGGIAAAAGVATALTLLLSGLIAWLVLQERIGESAIGYGAMVVLLLSSFVCGVLASAMVKHRRMVVCLLSGLTYFLCLLACTALFFGGRYQGLGVTALLILAGSVSAALIDLSRPRKRRKTDRRKMHTG
ncbi:MAG: TIGR04086 family membrane protein [Oscillospiraceae bacterium]|nr:TIGR04086 family membrane protein [Oscillospiraceae bacterium]